jgi:thiamine biosynthesis lipoprotein
VSDSYILTVGLMGTVVTFQIVGHGADDQERLEREQAVERAVDWFHTITAECSRFETSSELARLSAQTGVAVPVSAMLFEAVQFALAVADESEGAFDPTVGRGMEAAGFDTEFRSGEVAHSGIEDAGGVTFRDVFLDAETRTITLRRPMVLDLGAVAKGLAIDMAARELRTFENFAIDAGGDLFLGGCNPEGRPWSVGIRHPRDENEVLGTLHLSGVAVCTSGDYARRSPINAEDHHIIDARSGKSAKASVSATVVAPSAMVADALATAAFVLGPDDGIRLLERNGLDGLIVTSALEQFTTPGMRRAFHPSGLLTGWEA